MDRRETKYAKALDKRKKLYGIKREGEKGWHMEPQFENLGMMYWYTSDTKDVWFRQNGRYGLLDVAAKRVVIPAIYGFPLFFNEKGHSIAWRDYKAGVIDREGEVVIPFVYDEIETRYKRVPIPEEVRRTIKADDGTALRVGPTCRDEFRGYACFTNNGDARAYDQACQPDVFYDWEQHRLNHEPEYENKEVAAMLVDELEEIIKKEYVTLIELGYDHPQEWTCSKEHREKVDIQEQKVKSLIRDRRQKMNRSWIHNVENAKRIGRTNRLLMRAVRKAIRLGEKTSKSLQWMEKVSNTAHYEVEVYVHPEWQDSRSDLRYERKFKSAEKENNRLVDDEDHVADTHVWNIIAAVGGCFKCDGVGTCFELSAYMYDPDYWDEREITGDDGQSWDECIHFPAYQDEYFTMPFHHLYCDYFNFSFEDLCNINDFRVNVKVHLVTKEQD